MKKILLLLLLWSNSVYSQCWKPDMVDGAIADIVTTFAVVTSDKGVERNPFGIVGGLLAKGLSFYVKEDMTEENAKKMDEVGGAIWTGAAVNNVFVYLGAANPISLIAGISSAVYFLNVECPKK